MCWHKWGKWSEPFSVTFYTYVGGYKLAGSGHTKRKQKRTCTKCGKYQERFL